MPVPVVSAPTATKPAGLTASATVAAQLGTYNSTVQHQLSVLLKTLILQQQQRQQQQQHQQQHQQQQQQQQQQQRKHLNVQTTSVKGTHLTKEKQPMVVTSSKILTEAAGPSSQATLSPVDSKATAGSGGVEREITEAEVEGAILENFLKVRDGDVESSSSASRFIHTSSDTVNELLRGFSVKRQDKSIQKLSEETADVLPSFAKALAAGAIALERKDEPGSSSTSPTGETVSCFHRWKSTR